MKYIKLILIILAVVLAGGYLGMEGAAEREVTGLGTG